MDFLNYSPFRRSRWTDTTAFEGCTVEEINELERRCGITFPDDYREFLLQMGRNAGRLFYGLDYEISWLAEMQESVREVLAEDGLSMPSGSFAVLSSQGVAYWLVSTDGLFYYRVSTKKVVRQFNSFTDLVVDATARDGLPTAP